MNKTILVGTGVVVALVLSVLAITNSGTPGRDGIDGKDAVNLGSAGNVYTEPLYVNGGIQGTVKDIQATTTNFCMIQNPYTSTTTFRAHLNFLTASSSATVAVLLGTTTNTNRFSTSSNLSITSRTNVSGQKMGISYPGSLNQNILGPTEWVIFGLTNGTTGGGGLSAIQMTGVCKVLFEN